MYQPRNPGFSTQHILKRKSCATSLKLRSKSSQLEKEAHFLQGLILRHYCHATRQCLSRGDKEHSYTRYRNVGRVRQRDRSLSMTFPVPEQQPERVSKALACTGGALMKASWYKEEKMGFSCKEFEEGDTAKKVLWCIRVSENQIITYHCHRLAFSILCNLPFSKDVQFQVFFEGTG